MNVKICTLCNDGFPATTEFFYRDKNGRNGLKSYCKKCNKKFYHSSDEYKRKNRERQRIYASKVENKIKKKEYSREWSQKNPDKIKESNKRNYKKNGQKYLDKKRWQYQNDPVYKQKRIDCEKRYAESGRRREVSTTPEQILKNRLASTESTKNLTPSYIAYRLHISVKDLTPEILETKRLIIKLKRELKNNNIKIK